MHHYSAVYASPWVPSPLLESCGFTPVPIYDLTGIDGKSGQQVATEGRCPWSQIFSDHAARSHHDAIILATTCDQMRRSAESIARNTDTPIFILNVPTTSSPQALRFYQTELSRLTGFLSNISGIEPSGKSLANAISKLNATDPMASNASATATTPVCLLGSHLPVPFVEFNRALNAAGGYVIINGLEYGPSCSPRLATPAGNPSAEALLLDLAEAYFSSIRDIFRRPNNDFYRWLSTAIKKDVPQGILVVRNSWCDQWTVETVRLREWSELPVLELEFTTSDLSLSALSRMQAFIETCKR
jgi:benzoyl-CoA reductase/2-hydroxyglutaryl-CoA dehydratase subunit BcrC/BadD/HgdB